MKKFWIQVAALVIVIVSALYLSTNQGVFEPFLPVNFSAGEKQIKIAEAVVEVEIADTASKRSKGLSGRENLASSSGMLFIFNEPKIYQFWMKGMKFPLDLIFIKEGRVVDLLLNVLPPLPNQTDKTLPIYQSVIPIDMMLEVNANFVQRYNIKVGDTVFLTEK